MIEHQLQEKEYTRGQELMIKHLKVVRLMYKHVGSASAKGGPDWS